MAKSEPSKPSGKRQLFAILEGRPCPDCAEGELERGRYKNNRAVVCDSCEMPQVQVWSASLE
ncbi:HVO_A0556 family zinc finger protein [Natrinema salinisoli]|uniref:HVO_A0556 family zinc finger protein n=1 Tax=Natrinema salinisoli TaxID=2878535 RepID=UPI001CF03A82|nr:HVO_A0556 family zinc finger protein [Natrinema salinisoli]